MEWSWPVGSGGATATAVPPHDTDARPSQSTGRLDAGAAANLPPALWETACVIAEILLDHRQRTLAAAAADGEAHAGAEPSTM
jgi:hypothetical protein